MSKNIFERMGLVKAEYDTPILTFADHRDAVVLEPISEIDASLISKEDTILSVYQQANLSDENSIMKIRSYMDVLPQEMTRAKMQASIAGILAVNGIQVSELIEDGEQRFNILQDAENSIREKHERLTADRNGEIEQLKHQIEIAEEQIRESEITSRAQIAVITQERENISSLLEFTSGLVKDDPIIAEEEEL